MKKASLFLIRLYRKAVSPMFGSCCRFYPSCSHYGEQAIEQKGVIKGTWMLLKRLLKCHPFHPGGYDPVES